MSSKKSNNGTKSYYKSVKKVPALKTSNVRKMV